jgi:hypothetical protein
VDAGFSSANKVSAPENYFQQNPFLAQNTPEISCKKKRF